MHLRTAFDCRYAPTMSSIGSYYSLSQEVDGSRRITDASTMRPKYYRIDDDDANEAMKEVVSRASSCTPPPLQINDGYLDRLSRNVQIVNTETEHEMKADDGTTKRKVGDIESDSTPRNQSSFKQSAEHSLSATVPDTEFTLHERPLRLTNSEFLRIDGVAVHFCVERNYHEKAIANGDLPWLVLLHGFGGGLFQWRQTIPMMLEELQEDIQGILTFDRVGFGLTERPILSMDNAVNGTTENHRKRTINPYSMQFSIRILETLLDKFEVNKCLLIGHSTGRIQIPYLTLSNNF